MYYTCVSRIGNKLIHRYVKNNKRHMEFIENEFEYELFLKSDYSNDSLDVYNNTLKRYTFNSIYDMSQFIRENGIENIYGNTDPVSQFITKKYPNELQLTNEYVTLNFDIETEHRSGIPTYRYFEMVRVKYKDGKEEEIPKIDMQMIEEEFVIYDVEKKRWLKYEDSCYAPKELDFPDPNLALYEMLSISLIASNEDVVYVFGTEKYDGGRTLDNSKYVIRYVECVDEKDLLIKFIGKWRAINPDILTGWNCVPLTNTLWSKEQILSMKDALSMMELHNSTIKDVFPITKKQLFKTTLENGITIESSNQHIFPILCRGGSESRFVDCSLNEVSKLLDDSNNQVFYSLELKENYQQDFRLDNFNLDESLLWLLGIISTFNKGESIYKLLDKKTTNKVKFLNKTLFNNTTTVLIEDHYTPVFSNDDVKFLNNLVFSNDNLNLKFLSKLSKPQFVTFICGVIDAKGTLNDGLISLRDIANIKDFMELLQWNGYLSINNDNTLLTYINNQPLQKYMVNENNIKKVDSEKNFFNTPSDDVEFVGMNQYTVFVKVKSIEDMKQEVDMIDISTDTHYFISHGIKVHNCDTFDIPYTINRITNVLGRKFVNLLSPASKVSKSCVREKQNEDKITYEIVGITSYDYINLYKKFMREKKESYKLDYIGEIEVNYKKVTYEEYSNSLMILWERDFNRFVKYNATDTLIVNMLEDKLRFINLAVTIAHITHSDLSNALGTVKIWDNVIYHLLDQESVQIIPKTPKDKDAKFVGAFVKVPILGRHNWILTFDLTSLYPSLIRMMGFSPETIVHREIGKNLDVNKVVLRNLDDNLSYINSLISKKKSL